ncbi:MAG: hypothetical protein DRR00_30455 [Candidatus Parabeggiatoa sp. nov. 3]|nr:MAG: hypothetical protein DRR00_30455 [Gammaproteobacteria bacterium]RKZ69658.1 MAG: hypothetical protein DRQ99_00240 [Gammaproteobacteria bacterium]
MSVISSTQKFCAQNFCVEISFRQKFRSAKLLPENQLSVPHFTLKFRSAKLKREIKFFARKKLLRGNQLS